LQQEGKEVTPGKEVISDEQKLKADDGMEKQSSY